MVASSCGAPVDKRPKCGAVGRRALPAFEESDRLEGDQKTTTISEAVEQGLERGIEQERTRAIGTRRLSLVDRPSTAPRQRRR